MYGLFTLGEKWLHSRGNVSKYSLHGAFGNEHLQTTLNIATSDGRLRAHQF